MTHCIGIGVFYTQDRFNVVDLVAANDVFVAVMRNGHVPSLWQLRTLM
jgi:hypothetical protein